jgi:hypothetical protein
MGKKSDLSPECQTFVKKLFAFFSKEKATKTPIVSFDRVYQKTSKALGVSYTSVHRIMNGKRPCKSNRPKERARVRVSLDFDILIESFISICIIEKVGAIFREYKSWIVLLITQ